MSKIKALSHIIGHLLVNVLCALPDFKAYSYNSLGDPKLVLGSPISVPIAFLFILPHLILIL